MNVFMTLAHLAVIINETHSKTELEGSVPYGTRTLGEHVVNGLRKQYGAEEEILLNPDQRDH